MKSNLKIIVFINLIIAFAAVLNFAQKKVDYDGYFEIGGKSEYKNIYIESFYRAKLEYKLKINDYTKVEIDVRGNSEDRQIELYEASADFKLDSQLKLKVGDLKKRYGLEEQISHEKLLTINTSLINNYLEPLGFVSRDPGIQLYWNNKSDNTTIAIGTHYNESHRLTIVMRFDSKNIFGIDKVGAGFQLARERDNELPHTFIASIDASQDFNFLNVEFEMLTGQDPIASYYKKLDGKSGMVDYLGLKILLSNNITINNEVVRNIEPILLASYLAKDTDNLDVNSIQLIIGINTYFDKDIRFMINGNLILTNHDYNKNERTMYGSDVQAQLQIRW